MSNIKTPIDDNSKSKLDYTKNFIGQTGGSLDLSTTVATTAEGITADWLDILIVPDASEAVAFVDAGVSPAATVTSYPMAINQPYRIPWVSGHKLSAIMAAGDATLYYCPVQ